MSDTATNYAASIVALAEAEDALDNVENELLQLARIVDGNSELREKLTDRHIPVGRRLGFAESDALEGVHASTRTALALLIAANRIGLLDEISRHVARYAAERRDRELAEVTVAHELDDQQRERLREALEATTGKKLDLKVFVDPSVVGGVRAKVGDTVIDGSVAHRFEQVRTRMAG